MCLASRYACVLGMVLCLCAFASAAPYEPSIESLSTRPLPSWFNEAKFGIFVVWGPYSVPAFEPNGYAEWYGYRMGNRRLPAGKFHERVYGKEFTYEDFVPMFKAELFDPDQWCELFAASGAKYVVTTANYHDGFAMYPTQYAQFNDTDNWNSAERGPRRDLLGDLNEAGEARGLKMGIYYSIYEWFHPLWKDKKLRRRYVGEHFHPKFKEVVTNYKPWFIFLDGEWEWEHTRFKSEELAAWLYNESPVKDTVVVNDRWGLCRGVWGDVFESEYGGGEMCSPAHPWQEDRGIGKSYGYNRTENIDDYDSSDALIEMLCRCAGGGGNFLLCVGPTADGRIPVIMQQRLMDIGAWLEVHGDAIYGAQASPFWPRLFDWGTISYRDGKLYMMVYDKKTTQITVPGISTTIKSAHIMAHPDKEGLRLSQSDDTLTLEWPWYLSDDSVTVIALELDGEPQVSTIQHQNLDGSLVMNARAMQVHGTKAKPYYSGAGKSMFMAYWDDPTEYITANFVIDQPGEYALSIQYALSSKVTPAARGLQPNPPRPGSQLEVECNGKTFTLTAKPRKGNVHDLGTITFEQAGEYSLTLTPQEREWKGFGLQAIRFTRAN